MVDGKFMQGVTDVILDERFDVVSTLRSQGNQIGRQRELVINHWYDNNKSDWLLWVDSDVVISPETLTLLCESADAETRPIVSGVYFISDEPEEPLMTPWPCLFNWHQDGVIRRLHPMPENKLIKVGAAGMGYVLMHRNAIKTIFEKLGKVALFTEVNAHKKFTGEDIYFYSLCNMADVPVYAHTGATVMHMKRFAFDVNYYKAFTQQSRKPQDHKQKTKGKK